MEKICPTCNKPFKLFPKNKIYCSTVCCNARNGYKGAYKGVPTGTVGAIAELEVASDLMKKGYEVFRALSQSCSCDLAVLKDKKLIRLEVKSAYRNLNGKVAYPEMGKPISHRYDVIALYLHKERHIIYKPEL